jgi:hypothetical protein
LTAVEWHKGENMATQWTAGTTSGQVLTAATLNTIGAAWESWTPALTASTTNPNLGTTGTSVGRYARINKTIFGNAIFTFNGTGIAAGTGFYFCSLPITAQGAGLAVGSVIAIDVSTFASTAQLTQTDTVNRLIGVGTGGGGLVATLQATTYAWAAGDFIRYEFCYEAA